MSGTTHANERLETLLGYQEEAKKGGAKRKGAAEDTSEIVSVKLTKMASLLSHNVTDNPGYSHLFSL